MTMREFITKYGTRTVPLTLRCCAHEANYKNEARLLQEMAADLRSALEWFEAYAKAHDEGATR